MTKKNTAVPTPSGETTTVRSDAGERAVQWMTQKKNHVLIGAAGIVLVGVIAYSTRAQSQRREVFAESELNQARVSMSAGNASLAALDLTRIVNDHGGTKAGQEASILLAKVRLLEGNTELAVSELTTFLSGNPRDHFRTPALALMGNALEELGRFGEAADAYVRAADDSPYGLIRAQYLLEAGRAAATGGNRDRAAELFQMVIDENEGEDIAQEARLRLGEARPGGAV